jgi:hypothetical protein
MELHGMSFRILDKEDLCQVKPGEISIHTKGADVPTMGIAKGLLDLFLAPKLIGLDSTLIKEVFELSSKFMAHAGYLQEGKTTVPDNDLNTASSLLAILTVSPQMNINDVLDSWRASIADSLKDRCTWCFTMIVETDLTTPFENVYWSGPRSHSLGSNNGEAQ